MSPPRIVLALVLVGGVLGTGALVLARSQVQPAEGVAPTDALRQDPLAGAPFAELARAESDPARRLALHRIAVRRAPRDLIVRAWLAEHHLAAGRPTEAIAQLDIILRLSPEARKELLPILVQLAADPAFASAIAAHLATRPDWRRALLTALYEDPMAPGATGLLQRLASGGDLSSTDRARWIGALIGAGHWGTAYSVWSGGLERGPGEPLPMFWNGDFEQEVGGGAFNWRLGTAPGTLTELVPAPGGQGKAAHLVFLGRPVTWANLEHALHLPPGDYHLRMRVRAQDLRSQQGLEWVLACAGGARRSTGGRLSGTFDWESRGFDVHIPVTRCPGQWLRLRNPAPKGSASIVTGELWIDDVTLESRAGTY